MTSVRAAVRRGAGDGAEPPRPGSVLLEPSLEAQPLLAVAFKLGGETLRRGDVLDGEADQPVEGLQQIDVHLAALVRARPLDLELVGGRVGERLHVEQRLAAARLHVEHVAEQVLLLEAVRALCLGVRRAEFAGSRCGAVSRLLSASS